MEKDGEGWGNDENGWTAMDRDALGDLASLNCMELSFCGLKIIHEWTVFDCGENRVVLCQNPCRCYCHE
jgi:hypothetical protein